MEQKIKSGGDVVIFPLNSNDSYDEDQYLEQQEFAGQTSIEIKNDNKKDFERRNQDKLREIQERRIIEAQMNEEARNKMKR